MNQLVEARGRKFAIPLVSPLGDLWDILLIASIFAAIALLSWFTLCTPIFNPLIEMARRGDWMGMTLRPTVLWIVMALLLIFVRTILWLCYRPAQPVTDDEAPMLSVVIPAYNEGAMVAQSIESAAAADYPKHRLEVLVIDDGSTDDTWQHIEKAAARHPGLISAVRLPRNLGKRGALAEGFRRARGDLYVTMDSDSIIERGALRALAGPFRDPRVAAVAGKVLVLNRDAGLLPRMVHVRFVLSFDLLRSAQSVFRTVYCCPGALSAYRASPVRTVLERWESQTFFGVPCTYGEDRALTNFLFELGYDALYQRLAVVQTLVPETYGKLCRMFLRWERSFIREEFRFGRIVWRRPPMSRVAALIETTITNLRYPVIYLSLVLWITHAFSDPGALIRMLVAIGLASGLYSLYYLRSERSWDFAVGILYGYFGFFALSWIFPYAACTLWARGWLTR